MGLKELKPIHRISFLQFFVAELVKNTAKERELKEKIEAEKIKIKYVEPSKQISLDPLGNSVIFHQRPQVRADEQVKNHIPELKKSITREEPIEKEITPHTHRVKLPKRITDPSTPLTNESPLQKSKPIKSFGHQMTSRPSPSMSTPFQGAGNDYALKKIDPLIQDPAVQMIECPGAGKNILVKARNKINSTKITLNEVEIKNIINYFSSYTKIPVIGGILKAAIDNLIISAIASEYAGSRFIINKKSPYQLIEGTK